MADTLATAAQSSLGILEEALAALSAERAKVAELTRERDHLRASHERLRLELELLRRRIFVAKAERVDTRQLEMDFAATLAELDKLTGTVAGTAPETAPANDGEVPAAKPKVKGKPTGRRDLSKLLLEEERVEIADEVFEKLVAEGKAERFGFEESLKLAYKRGGMRRLVVARVKYRVVVTAGESQIETTPMPAECFPRSLAAPSALAHVLSDKFCDGLPLNRIEDRSARDGAALDRGTMSRWVEDAGATAGATVVAAMRKDALANAFCIATDATGIAVQPEPRPDGAHQPCRRGHFFVLVADRDHILYEYTPKETSAFVAEMFAGYSGYVQADAKSVYNVLFRVPETPDADQPVRHEIGCMSHCRRKFWEATCAKSEVAREGLARLGRIFALEGAWRKDPPDTIKRLRNQHLRPHLEAFFAWAEREYEKVADQRGLLRSRLRSAAKGRSDARSRRWTALA